MEKSDVKIPKFVILSVARELKHFIEDRDAAFKFHPWQTNSVVGKFQETVHIGLPERAIHHLYDTGTAGEILRFSKNVSSCEKVRRVTCHLLGLLGINIYQAPHKDKAFGRVNQKQHLKAILSSCNTPENGFFKDTNKLRIFEVQKLVESVAQELINIFSTTPHHNNSTLYSYKLGKYHLEADRKQQKLARCTSAACLFQNKENILENDHNQKLKKRFSNLKTHRENQGRSLRLYTFKQKHIISRAAVNRVSNTSKKFNPVKIKKTRQIGKRHLVETATQTNSWKGDSVSNKSSKVTDDESFELEDSSTLDSDIYCKSDTLNDASMITEEIASEFVVATPKHASRKSSRKPSASKSPDIGSRVIQFLNKKAKETTEKEQLDNISKSKSIKLIEERSQPKNIVKSHDSLHPNSNSKVSASPAENKSQKLDSKVSANSNPKKSQKSNSKVSANPNKPPKLDSNVSENPNTHKSPESDAKVSENSNAMSPCLSATNIKNCKEHCSSKSQAPSVVFHPPKEKENKHQKLLKSKCQDETVENPEIPEDIDKDVPRSPSNVRSKIPLQDLHSFPTSSENDTTVIPMDSISLSSESLASSFKENDNTSPEYSSHWTEEELSSDADSEFEMDDSFKEKFRAYKESLLEEDDGIVASCEDEITRSESLRDEKYSMDYRDEIVRDNHRLLQTFEMNDLQNFENMINENKTLLSYANKDGYNLLHLAASKGFLPFVEFLLNAGIPVGGATKKGFTALHLAIFNGHANCCHILLQNGAQLINEVGEFDKRILAMKGEMPNSMKALLQQYDDNLRKVQKLCDIFNQIGNKKKTTKAIPQNVLSALADLTFDDEN